MDGSNFGPNRAGFLPEERHLDTTPAPEREWGLSAGQVVAVVLAILAASEVIGLILN